LKGGCNDFARAKFYSLVRNWHARPLRAFFILAPLPSSPAEVSQWRLGLFASPKARALRFLKQ
jgi:hypothetical protein